MLWFQSFCLMDNNRDYVLCICEQCQNIRYHLPVIAFSHFVTGMQINRSGSLQYAPAKSLCRDLETIVPVLNSFMAN